MVQLDEGRTKGGIEGVSDRVAEIKMPLSEIGADPGKEVLLSFTLWREEEPIEKAPLFSLIKMTVPDNYDLEYWIV